MKLSLTAITFVCRLSEGLMLSGYYRRSENYRSALRSVLRFCGDESLLLKTLFSRRFLRDYESFLACTGCARNTISFYMSTLRSIYNQAVGVGGAVFIDGLFDDVFTGSTPTVKRAVDSCVVARIIAGDLSCKPRLEACRDYFLLSLYLQGMPFVDLVHLRKCDVQNDLIIYRRRKTGGVIQVSVLPEARALLEKYAIQTKGSPYVLPLITGSGKAGHRQYKSVLHRQNRQLKAVAEHLGISENLTTYVARHCWATFAYHGGANVGVISQGMGHHTEEVTRTYLSSFGRSELEKANRIVLNAILSPIVNGEIGDVCPQMQTKVVQRMKEIALSLNSNMGTSRFLCGKDGCVESFGRVVDDPVQSPRNDSGRASLNKNVPLCTKGGR